MPLETYKLIHLAALILLTVAFGGMLFGRGEDGRAPRRATLLHGLGLLAMLVAGFGMLARLGISWPWPGWVFGKLLIWVVLGALPVLIRRRRLPPVAGALTIAVLATAAAALVLYKPF